MGDETQAKSTLNGQLKKAAADLVGKDAITSAYGYDCFALVDSLLRGLGAQTAEDGTVAVTETADYDWGDPIKLGEVQVGDILQFKNHLIDVSSWTLSAGKWYETKGQEYTRPHHTAIVTAVNADGSYLVVEQNVKPNPAKVSGSVIMRLASGTETRMTGDKFKTVIKVTGRVRAYRPLLKPPPVTRKADATVVTGSPRATKYVPADGGAKRTPGPMKKKTKRPAFQPRKFGR